MKNTIFAIAILLTLSACHQEEIPLVKESELPTAEVQQLATLFSPSPHTLEVAATIQAVKQADIAARRAGDIINIPVEVGQEVQKGDLLVELAGDELVAALREAEVALVQAKRNLERETRLLKKNAATQEKVKNLQDNTKMAQARVEQAKTMASFTKIRAPYSGIIISKPAQLGDLATPGRTLLQLENKESYELIVDVPETRLTDLQNGMELSVSIPSTSFGFIGKIKEISPIINQESHTSQVKLSVAEDLSTNLKSGMFAKVQLPENRKTTPSLFVPAAAVQRFGQIEQVFVPGEGKAWLRLVRTGAKTTLTGESMVEILSGLDAGENVLVSKKRLQNGQPIQIIN